MPIYKGMSGRITLGNENSAINPNETKIGSRYDDNICTRPTLLNLKENKDLTLDECTAKCENNQDCDYMSHTSVKGDPNRECNRKYKNWNKNLAIPTGRPCIPKNGKSKCDLCYIYNVKNIKGSNKKQSINLVPNEIFTTITKDNIKVK